MTTTKQDRSFAGRVSDPEGIWTTGTFAVYDRDGKVIFHGQDQEWARKIAAQRGIPWSQEMPGQFTYRV